MKKRIGIYVASILMTHLALAGLIGSSDSGQALNIGYSDAMLAHVNEADAVAAIKTWVEMIKEAWNSSVPSTTSIYSGTEKLTKALQSGDVDLISVPTDEFFKLKQDVQLDSYHLGSYKGRITVENLLLVHCDSGFETLEDLKDKTLLISAADRLGMSELWLDTLLMQQGKGRISKFFDSMKVKPKSSSAVHGVFFRTVDACLVTRRNFDLITELNPQLGRKLKAIEVSPQLVPAVVCMRASYDAESKQDLSNALIGLHGSIRGQHMLSFFNSDKMVTATLDDLAATLELIEQHDLLEQNADSGSLADARVTSEQVASAPIIGR